jgi:hypothetical protein
VAKDVFIRCYCKEKKQQFSPDYSEKSCKKLSRNSSLYTISSIPVTATGIIMEACGRMEKIESRLPSLDEMLLQIWK